VEAMLNLLRVEFYKLKTSKIFWLMVLAGIGQGIAGPLLTGILRTKTGVEMFLFSIQLQQFLMYMPIIGIFGYFVGSEFYTGSVKNLIAYGHRRRDIILAKSIAFYAGAVILSFIFPIVITLINTVLNGYGRTFDIQSLFFILRVSLLMTIIYVGMASIVILLAYLFRNAIAASAIFISLDTVCRFGQAMSLRSEMVKAIYGKTVFYQLNLATLEEITFSQGLNVTAISLITIMLSTAIAIIAFRRADIK
jgi:ABC-2 type transport system permease protein